MKPRLNILLRSVLAASLALLVVASAALAADPVDRNFAYEVTITNLTDGQPFSPPVLVTHRAPVNLFELGKPASYGIQQIAENGNFGPLVAALENNPYVSDIVTGEFPLVPAGTPGAAMFPDSATYTIDAESPAHYLSIASMLICTNDGFTGFDSVPVGGRVGQSVTLYVGSYDAGTEVNTEDFADIVPPCQGLIGVTSDDPGTGMTNPALAENGVVMQHAGIAGGEDLLPEVHGWSDPVAMITITRVN